MKTSLWKSHVLVYSSMPPRLVHLKGQFTKNTNQSERVRLSVWVLGRIQRIWSSVDNQRQQQKCKKKKNGTKIELCLVTVSALKGSVCVLVPLIFPDSVLFLRFRTVGNARSLGCSSAFSDLDWTKVTSVCHSSSSSQHKEFYCNIFKYCNPDLVFQSHPALVWAAETSDFLIRLNLSVYCEFEDSDERYFLLMSTKLLRGLKLFFVSVKNRSVILKYLSCWCRCKEVLIWSGDSGWRSSSFRRL